MRSRSLGSTARLAVLCAALGALGCTTRSDEPPQSGGDGGGDGGRDSAVAEDAATEDASIGDANSPGQDAASDDAQIGDGDASYPDEQITRGLSGERLAIRSLGAAGSDARTLVEIYDRELQVPCTFELAHDGTLRCMPLGRDLELFGYADEDCEEPLFASLSFTPCQNPPPWGRISEEELDTCGRRTTHAYALTDNGLQTNDVSYYYGDRCQYSDSHFLQNNLYEARELEPAEMVEAAVAKYEAGAGLRVLMLEATDGARIPYGIEDTSDGMCSPYEVSELGLRCIPTWVGIAGDLPKRDAYWKPESDDWRPSQYWADTECGTEPLAQIANLDDEAHPGLVCRGEPRIVLLTDDRSEPPALFALGAPEPEPRSYSESTDQEVAACLEIDQSAALEYPTFRLGEPLASEDLPELTEQRVGEADVQVRVLATNEGERLAARATTAFYDVSRDAPCVAWPTRGDSYRCLPEDMSAKDPWHYADVICTKPLLIVDEPTSDQVAIVELADACGASAPNGSVVVAVRELGELYSGPVYAIEDIGDDPDFPDTACVLKGNITNGDPDGGIVENAADGGVNDGGVIGNARMHALGEDLLAQFPELVIEEE